MFAAWLSYIVSFFLPTATFMYESVIGWAAALFSIQSIIQFYKSLFMAYLSVLGLCNIFMLLSPVFVIYSVKKRKFWGYRLAMSAATIAAVSFLFYEGLRYRFFELKAGYYIWASSFFLASVSLFIERRFYYRN